MTYRQAIASQLQANKLPMPLDILYRDAHYIAVYKPPNLLLHRSPISQDEVFLLQLLRNQIGQWVYPVHRLDRATAGLVVFGLDPEAAQRLAQHFTDRTVEKVYWLLCRGWVDESATIDHPVLAREERGEAKPAITDYRRLAAVELPYAVDRYPSSRYSLVEARPRTGRRHQIRKHFKHISHHLIGDTTYGNGKHNRFFREQFGINRLLLLSRELHFVHPYSGEQMDPVAPLDDEWQLLLTNLGIEPETIR